MLRFTGSLVLISVFLCFMLISMFYANNYVFRVSVHKETWNIFHEINLFKKQIKTKLALGGNCSVGNITEDNCSK